MYSNWPSYVYLYTIFFIILSVQFLIPSCFIIQGNMKSLRFFPGKRSETVTYSISNGSSFNNVLEQHTGSPREYQRWLKTSTYYIYFSFSLFRFYYCIAYRYSTPLSFQLTFWPLTLLTHPKFTADN